MEAPLESPAEEITRLRGCLNHLVRIMALPAPWSGGEPSRIVSSLFDALVGMLHLSFAFIRLNDPEGGPSIEMARVAEPLEGSTRSREIGEAIEGSLGDAPLKWPPRARVSIGDFEFSITSTRLGLQGELGVAVAGSQNVDFPEQTEALLLDVVANQASLALQRARLVIEQERVFSEIDQRVAQRTPELATSNEE